METFEINGFGSLCKKGLAESSGFRRLNRFTEEYPHMSSMTRTGSFYQSVNTDIDTDFPKSIYFFLPVYGRSFFIIMIVKIENQKPASSIREERIKADDVRGILLLSFQMLKDSGNL